MKKILFDDQKVYCKEGETILESFLRQGISIPFSCRNGTCQTCMLKATKGAIPKISQNNIKQYLRKLGYFLPCKCVPENDMVIQLPNISDLYETAVITKKEFFTNDICRLYLEPNVPLEYNAGQFINIRHPEGESRSYSLASVADTDYELEIHVKRMPGGLVSNWLLDKLNEGDVVEYQGSLGKCYYRLTDIKQNILLIGSGTGISPLVGIVRDALNRNHSGQIFLYHGAKIINNLYMHDCLEKMSQTYNNLHYSGCLSQEIDSPEYSPGRVDDIAFANHEDLAGWAIYLCGHADMVESGYKKAVSAGAEIKNIYSDTFLYRDKRTVNRKSNSNTAVDAANAMEYVEERSEYPRPDPELWHALDKGVLLAAVLNDFYTVVYNDTRLSPFFHGVTKQRAIEKQYSFLHQVFTGEKVYFGDRPRNAHHWMVISDELFDYRENLMIDCLRRHGLEERFIERWRKIDESYREKIVKTRPWPKIVDGIRYPLEGFENIEITVGSICDGCKNEILPGENVIYHVRLGTIFCKDCQNIQKNEVKS